MRAAISVLTIVASTSVGAAAGQDLRRVGATAEQDLGAMRSLVLQGVDAGLPR